MKINRFAEHVAGMVYRHGVEVHPVPFNEVARDPKPCLICMPDRLDMIKPAAEILPDIANALSNRSIKIILTSSVDPQSHDIIKKFLIVRVEPHEIGKFSLPKREFISRISEGGPGIVIDMDTRPNFFNAVVALRCGAAIRTAFDKGVGLPYYNFIVGRIPGDDALRAAYKAMADILGNFRQ